MLCPLRSLRHIKQEEVATRVGKDRTVITTSMRLLRLPGEIQKAIEEGRLSAGHGRALVMTDDPKIQRRVANAAIDGGWSVRETERAVKRAAAERQPVDKKQVNRTVDANFKSAETKLMRALNTNVKIVPGKKGKGGKIEIEYYGTDDLDRVFQLIIKK